MNEMYIFPHVSSFIIFILEPKEKWGNVLLLDAMVHFAIGDRFSHLSIASLERRNFNQHLELRKSISLVYGEPLLSKNNGTVITPEVWDRDLPSMAEDPMGCSLSSITITPEIWERNLTSMDISNTPGIWERDLTSMDNLFVPIETGYFVSPEILEKELCVAGDRTSISSCPLLSRVPFNFLTEEIISRKRKYMCHSQNSDDNQDDLENNFLTFGMDAVIFDTESMISTPSVSSSVINFENYCHKQVNTSNRKALKEENYTILDWSSLDRLTNKLLDMAGSSKSCEKYKEIVTRLSDKLATSVSIKTDESQTNDLIFIINNIIATVCVPSSTQIKVYPEENYSIIELANEKSKLSFTIIKTEKEIETFFPIIKEERKMQSSQVEYIPITYPPVMGSLYQDISCNHAYSFSPFVPLYSSSADSMGDHIDKETDYCISMEGSDEMYHPNNTSQFSKSTYEDNDILSFEDTWTESFFESV